MSERWYEEGLPFSCTACGNCCKSRGEYSHVYLREEEVTAMARHLEMDPVEFVRTQVKVEDGWITLLPGLPQCQFLDDAGKCTVYAVRPVQCRTWPSGTSTSIARSGPRRSTPPAQAPGTA